MLKKHGKTIAALALVAAIGGGVTIAHADPITQTTNTKAKNPYASQIKTVNQTIKSNRDANKNLESSIKQKRQQIKDKLTQLKQDKALKSKKEAVKAQNQKIKQDLQALKSLQTTFKSDEQAVKSDKTAKNYQQLLSDLNNIPSLQTQRTQLLQQLSNDLDGMLSILGN